MRKHFPLILALALPVIMTLLVALSIYIPRLYTKPEYSFIYSTLDYGITNYSYRVLDNRITREGNTPSSPSTYPYFNKSNPILYLYDINSDSAKEISFEEAQNYKLDPSLTSPDGFEITEGSSGGGFLFFYSSYDRGRYLQKKNITKKLNLVARSSDLYSFKLVGWVIE